MNVENRKQKRVVLRQVVTIDGCIKAVGLDLSSGGLYIHTGRHFPVGTTVSITLHLFGDAMSARARVQHSKEAIGMGVQFIDLTSWQRLTIERYIDSRIENPSVVAIKKVLIVDDNATARRMNQSRLVADGFSVVEAADGLEALALLEKESIQLVILDLYMERMDGFKVLSMMRQKPEWSKIPVLVFSGRSSSGEIDRALSAGATEFLSKMTTSPAKLSARVKIHLSSKS
jgi:CheY-like chemotaxis protein